MMQGVEVPAQARAQPRRGATPSWFAGRVASVRCALNGVLTLLATQPNARIHAAAALAVVAAGVYCKLSAGEWCALVLAMALVWIAEAINTALEFLVDLICPALHPLAAKAKDVAAAAVLIAAAAAVVIGLLIFMPYVPFQKIK